MARIPDADPADGSDAALFRALAHVPEPLRRYQQLGKSLVFAGRLPSRLTELAVLAVAHRRGCAYLWSHHCDIGRAGGLTDAELRALRDGQPGLGPLETAVLRFAVAADDATVGDAEIDGLRAAGFDPAGIVELTMVSTFYGMTARIVAALDVELEPGRPGFESP